MQPVPSAENAVPVQTRLGLTVVGKETRLPPRFECRQPAMFDAFLNEDDVRQLAEARP